MPLLDPLTNVASALRKDKIIPDVRITSNITLFVQRISQVELYRKSELGDFGTRENEKVIPENFTPSILFTITWPDSLSGEVTVLLGSEMKKETTQTVPNVQITPIAPVDLDTTTSGPSQGPTYTLASLDPDAPSREDHKYGPYRHWIVSNIFFLSYEPNITWSIEPLILYMSIDSFLHVIPYRYPVSLHPQRARSSPPHPLRRTSQTRRWILWRPQPQKRI